MANEEFYAAQQPTARGSRLTAVRYEGGFTVTVRQRTFGQEGGATRAVWFIRSALNIVYPCTLEEAFRLLMYWCDFYDQELRMQAAELLAKLATDIPELAPAPQPAPSGAAN